MNKHAGNLRTARPHLDLHPYILANTESCAVWSTLQESCQAQAILLHIQSGVHIYVSVAHVMSQCF
jgi:hypothetical protein